MELIEGANGEKYYLASSLENLGSFLTQLPKHSAVAVDTETTGLNTLEDKIVGWSMSIEERSAIYVPVAHKIGTNVSLSDSVGMLDTFLGSNQVYPVFWNGKFDVSMFESNCGWVPKYYEDVMASVYLENPDREEKGLKAVALEDLGFQMEHFEDLFTPEERKAKMYDISTKAPRRCVSYASSDADATLRLYLRYAGIKEQFKLAHQVDTRLMEVIRGMEQHGGMELNIQYIDECLESLKKREKVLEEMIFRAAGTTFAIGSPKQLGDILFGKLGLPEQGKTASGQLATGAKELAKLAESFPIAEWVVSYKKVQKAQGSYFEKLKRLHETGMKPRFSFNQYAAPTYRLAAPGGDPKVDGKTGVNIQAVSNGEARALMAVELDEAKAGQGLVYAQQLEDDDLLFTDSQSLVLPEEKKVFNIQEAREKPWVWTTEGGTKVCILDSCTHCDVGCAEAGLDITRRQTNNILVIPSVRQSFRAPKGYVIMSCDYDRQELVIGANLSKEPKWLKALLNDEDLHAITAMAAFKLSPEQWERLAPDEKKRKRGIGKILNFATFYGATAHTLARNTGLPLATAEAIYDGFVKGHSTLFNWMDRVKLFARRNGYTTTYFGRRRWLKQFYDQNTTRMKAFGDRSAVNTAVQGTGADVTRIAMVKTSKWLTDNQVDRDQAQMVLSIHDELVFLLKEDLLDVVGPHLVRSMMFNVKGWAVQLSVEPKIGTVWGNGKKYKFPELLAA